MTIHKEGYSTIFLITLVLTLLNTVLFYLLPEFKFIVYFILVVSAAFLFFILSFFRSPTKKIVLYESGIISPADGKVVAIEVVDEPEYFKDKRLQISVFMSPLNVHINRYPISGIVKYFKHHNGHFHVAWHPKSSSENERTSTVVQHSDGQEVLFKQIAGAVARRIVSYAQVSTGVVQGTECGFIKFGSRVDLLLPLNSDVQVKIGDTVEGGMTVLANFSKS